MTLDDARAQAIAELDATISARASEIMNGQVTELEAQVQADQDALAAKRTALEALKASLAPASEEPAVA